MNNLSRRTNFFDDFFTNELLDFKRAGFPETGLTSPSVNVKEDADRFQIMVAAPGIKKENFNINLEKNILTISSENKTENAEVDENGTFTRREFNYNSFSRSFTLPETVESEKIEATYEDGILNVTVPKKEESTQVLKTIEVK